MSWGRSAQVALLYDIERRHIILTTGSLLSRQHVTVTQVFIVFSPSTITTLFQSKMRQ